MLTIGKRYKVKTVAELLTNGWVRIDDGTGANHPATNAFMNRKMLLIGSVTISREWNLGTLVRTKTYKANELDDCYWTADMLVKQPQRNLPEWF
jgi:hypothetical protein